MTAIIDANGATLGRLSTVTAKRLLNGEEIAVINSEKAIISGKKVAIKNRYKQLTGHLLKEGIAGRAMNVNTLLASYSFILGVAPIVTNNSE